MTTPEGSGPRGALCVYNFAHIHRGHPHTGNELMRRSSIILGCLIATLPRTALACGLCGFAAVDYALPPAGVWFIVPLSWFFLTGVILAGEKVSSPLIPGVMGTLGLTAAALLAGAAFAGPIATIPLALPAAWVALRSTRGLANAPDRHVRKALIWIGAVHVAVIAAAGVAGLLERSGRTDAEFICKWPGTAPASAVFKRLARTPDAAAAYREILSSPDADRMAGRAATELAEISNDPRDIALLEAARQRVGENSYETESIDEAVTKMRERQQAPLTR